MTLLDNFPHSAVAMIRQRTSDAYGGNYDEYAIVSGWTSGVLCWQQAAKESEILEFEKRGISVTDKIYFTSDPGLDERFTLQVTNVPRGGDLPTRTRTYDVRSFAEPDASAGMGVVWRVMCEYRTTEDAHATISTATAGTSTTTTVTTSSFEQLQQGNVSGASTINLASYTARFLEVRMTLTNDATLSFTDPQNAAWITLVITQNATGYHQITWPTLDGQDPVIKLEPSSVTIVRLYFDGSAYHSDIY